MVREKDDDAALVKAFRAGDREAFACLVLRHRSRLVRLATAVLGDAAGAEDVAQEACYRAYFEIVRLQEPRRFGAWICGIAVNLARMALRSSSTLLSLDAIDGLPSFAPIPEDTIIAREATQRLQTALDELPQEMREAVRLHYVEGMSYDEAGALTGASAGKLRVLSHRARQRLQRELADQRPSTKRRSVVEVVVDSAWIRMRKDGEFDPVLRTPRWVVILRAKDTDRAMSIWTGPAEAEAIARHMAGVQFPRPQTYSFIASLVAGAGARVEQVTITDLVEDTYLARVTLKSGKKHTDVDARPSDAINLALATNTALEVSDELIARVGFAYSELDARLAASVANQQDPELEWRKGAPWMEELFKKRSDRIEAQRQAAAEAARRFREPPP